MTRTLTAPARRRAGPTARPRMFEAPDASDSQAPAEIDGQEVFVHKRVNLFPRGQSSPRGGRPL